MNFGTKVILNLSPLGGNLKTGVYRVSEHLIVGLAETMGANVVVHPVDQPDGSFDYFNSRLAHTGAVLAFPKQRLWLLPLSKVLNSFVTKTGENRTFVYRLARRTATTVTGWIDFMFAHIDRVTLREAAIYHSPFGKIPAQVRRIPNLRRFTTIYDLIPLTHPQYFKRITIENMRGIIANLDENDYALCISAATREALLANSRVSPERALVVPLAASAHFHPTTDLEKNSRILSSYGIHRPGYILSLCTFEIRKNLETVIRAFARLHADRLIPPDTRLVLVGGKGWKTQNLEDALSAASAVRNLIVMPGFIPDDDLAAIYSSARVFTYMSFMEGFGLPPLEAMQCGTPVITSNTSSLPEVVGDAGVMLAPTDVSGLCKAVARVYEDEAYHSELSRKSLARAKLFSWERFIEGTLQAYQRALTE
jgi:glycosyltransferase involved in cell wall biosynthesis